MTKAELIKRLHNEGEFWACEKNTKKELEDHLKGIERARNMSDADLFAMYAERR